MLINSYIKLPITLFFLLMITEIIFSQKALIEYFSSDSSSYMIPDLYASVNGKQHTLICNKESDCFSIESVKDYNGDGKPDILIAHILGCGGNCCGNSYFIFSFHNGGFIKSNEVGNGNFLKNEHANSQYSILIKSNVYNSEKNHRRWVTERYILKNNTLSKIKEYQPAKINCSDSDYNIHQWSAILKQNNSYFIHPVKKQGQSLWALANKYKTSVEAIKKLNKNMGDVIHIGDKLKIPENNSFKYRMHKVSSNDESLWKLSQKYHVPVEVIKVANGLTDNIIKIGEFLKIPEKN